MGGFGAKMDCEEKEKIQKAEKRCAGNEVFEPQLEAENKGPNMKGKAQKNKHVPRPSVNGVLESGSLGSVTSTPF